MDNYYIITGAPGSGKSAILSALEQAGYHTVPEPARQILAEQRAIDGQGVYDKNPFLFKELMLSRAMFQHLINASEQSPVFFDRGVPDLIAYTQCFGLEPGDEVNASQIYHYNNIVFFTPSWEAIYRQDDERKMSFQEAAQFGDHLRSIYQKLQYQLIEVPYVSCIDRAQFIFKTIKTSGT